MRDLIYMARDFLRVVLGKDYFHEPAHLGRYFLDQRCYYYDFSMKVDWPGPMKDGVPLLYIPAWGRSVFFPIMVLQFGLGAVDRYFENGDPALKIPIESVTDWIMKNVLPNGSFDNLFPQISPRHEYHSANSALAQGQALSFLSRVRLYTLVPKEKVPMIDDLLRRIFANMVLPLAEGGTAVFQEENISFCETCRRDAHIVLNGWIYALFGLFDYRRVVPGPIVEDILARSLKSLDSALPSYMMSCGWSLYDNKGRVSSPVYHTSHVVLLEALWLLTKHQGFEKGWSHFRRGDSLIHRFKFTVRKVAEKLLDRQAYLTH